MAKYKLLLPKMGESVAEATIIKWSKNPGDCIETDEPVMEIATDKVDSDVPSPVSGKLLEQLYKENEVVQVGAVIAIIETADPEEIKGTPNTEAVQEEQPVATKVPSVMEAGHLPKEETIAEALETKQPLFTEQRKELTEKVPFSQQLKEIAAGDKAENPFKNSIRFYSPLVKSIAAQEGISSSELDKIPGTGAESRLTKDDLLNHLQNRFLAATVQQSGSVTETPEPSSFEPIPVVEPPVIIDSEIPVPHPVTGQFYTEPVKEILPSGILPGRSFIDPVPVSETIHQKPIQQEPVENTITSTSVSGGDEIIEMDRMRRLIADHMVMSVNTSPHVTSFVEADVTNLVLWREKVKTNFEKREREKITFTPIFIEAVVKAIKDFPMINISVTGTQIIKKKDINISMATSLPNGNLIVPVIKRADELSLIGLTKAVNDLANRARINKLKPDDVQGGTFTITNVGSFGNVMGTPIINQPQVAILAVGAIRKKPAVIETLQGDLIGIRHMMFLSLSYDHRVVDGALGGSFVKRVADYLEKWDVNREI